MDVEPQTWATSQMNPVHQPPTNLFLDPLNQKYLIKACNQLGKMHNIRNLGLLREQLPGMMSRWANRRGISRFEIDAGDTYDWDQTLDFLNSRFMDENRNDILKLMGLDQEASDGCSINLEPLLDADLLNRKKTNLEQPWSGVNVMVGNVNEFEDNRQFKDIGQLAVEDYQTLDVWAPTAVYAWDRYPETKYNAFPEWRTGLKSRFPIQQASGWLRRYDKANEGYRDSADHSERTTHLRAFDMSHIPGFN